MKYLIAIGIGIALFTALELFVLIIVSIVLYIRSGNVNY